MIERIDWPAWTRPDSSTNQPNAPPVLAREPRRQETRHGQQLAYDLAVSQIHPQALARLAAYVSRETRRPYTETLAEVRGGWPLVADGLKVVDTAVSGDDRKRPFFVWWPVGVGVYS